MKIVGIHHGFRPYEENTTQEEPLIGSVRFSNISPISMENGLLTAFHRAARELCLGHAATITVNEKSWLTFNAAEPFRGSEIIPELKQFVAEFIAQHEPGFTSSDMDTTVADFRPR